VKTIEEIRVAEMAGSI